MQEVERSSGSELVRGRDWTKGGIIQNVWLLSWPMLVTETIAMGSLTLDMIWVGKLGAAPIAGMGVASILVLLVATTKIGLLQGVRAIVARFIGAGDAASANHVARQGIVISAIYAAVMTATGVFFAEPILRLFGLEADVVAEGVLFMRVMFAGMTFQAFLMLAYNIMQAIGDTVTPMRISLFARSVHILICPFLVFGWWVFPQLGVCGAAASNVTAWGLMMCISWWVLFTGRTRLRLTLKNFRLAPDVIWRILKVGIPASIMGAQRAIGNLALAWFMVPFGTLAVAAHSLAQRLEVLLFVPSFTLGRGAGVLVGQNLGARQPGRAERSGWLATGFVQVIMLVASVAILLWAENIIRLFNTEPDLVQLASIFLRIAAAGYILMGFVFVLQESIAGAGDTLPVMLIIIAMVWLVQIPLAFLLPRVTELGVYGVRWAIVAGLGAGALANITYFRLGRWQHKRV